MLQVELSKEAKKALRDIEKHIAQRIAKKIGWLAKNSEHINHIPLKGQFEGTYKLRVGDYRVIYEIIDDTPTVLLIILVGHRKEVYRG